MKSLDNVLTRLEELIEKGRFVLSTHRPPTNSIGFPTLNHGCFAEWQTQALSLLENVFGEKHTYTSKFRESVLKGFRSQAETGIGILKAAREDIDKGYIINVRTLLTAEVFTDFLEMSEHLLDRDYYIPAASLIGAVLEDSLRKMLIKNGVKIGGGDDLNALNQKCVDAEIYNQVKRKEVQLWTDIRNKADHGNFDQIDKEQVKRMLDGVTHFLGEYLK